MKSTPRLHLLAALCSLAAAASVYAHPGHSHADIPSLIRHPFAGPQHILGSAAVGIAVAGLLYVVTRRVPMPALVRWMGVWVVAAGVTVGLAV